MSVKSAVKTLSTGSFKFVSGPGSGETFVNTTPHNPRAVSLLDTIGNTPMVRLEKLNTNPLATVYVKLEFMNPSGSIKDRIVKHIIETYESKGILKKGGIVVENSSGNTAAGVAMVCALKGYQSILVVPHKCSQEKQQALKAYGARLVVSPPGAKPGTPYHYESIAIRLAKEIPNAIRLDQYNNLLNVEAHYQSTGPEIWRQAGGKVDFFVAGASTGGTVSGTGRFLKEKSNGQTQVVVVDPSGSSIYSRFKSGEYKAERFPCTDSPATQIEGIGKDYEVQCMNFEVVDDVLRVTDKDAIVSARRMALEEGILCGGSSGANVWAALQLAATVTEPTTIVTVLPDGGIKYLSKYFNPVWLYDNGIIDEEEKSKLLRSETLEGVLEDFVPGFSANAATH